MNEKDREKLKEIEAWHIRLPEGEAEKQVERLHEHRGWLLDAIKEKRRAVLTEALTAVDAVWDRVPSSEGRGLYLDIRDALLHIEQGGVVLSKEERDTFNGVGPLTQARALLQRARSMLGGAVGADAERTRVELGAFLAGLPVTSESREVCGERHPKGEATCEREPHGDVLHRGGGLSWKIATAESLGMTEGPMRPRVGPWVGSWKGKGWQGRHHATGGTVGEVWLRTETAFGWMARRPFESAVEGEAPSIVEAQAAVDAVLRTWADLDGEANESVEHPWFQNVSDGFGKVRDPLPTIDMRDKVPGGYRPPEPTRTWTEEQIRARWDRLMSTPEPVRSLIDGLIDLLQVEVR